MFTGDLPSLFPSSLIHPGIPVSQTAPSELVSEYFRDVRGILQGHLRGRGAAASAADETATTHARHNHHYSGPRIVVNIRVAVWVEYQNMDGVLR